jgi:hypothetical protein
LVGSGTVRLIVAAYAPVDAEAIDVKPTGVRSR